jgi:hypothetical protein
MSDIFLSYASEDKSIAEALSKALEEQGWSVWWDRTIPPGKTFDQVIEEAINTAKCVVVLWSTNSIKSDWVKEEANIAKERGILVPAKIDPVDPPLGFGLIQAADLTDWESEISHAGFAGFINAISDITGQVSQQSESEQGIENFETSLEKQVDAKSTQSKTIQPDSVNLDPGEKRPPANGPEEPRKKWLPIGIGAVVVVTVLIVIGLFVFSQLNEPKFDHSYFNQDYFK